MFFVVMKTKINLLALGTTLFLLEAPAYAQISESESSVNVLAAQCSVSSGFSTTDFDDYSRRLAKTLALLSPAQQTRVFGYLPQPNGAMTGDSSNLPRSTGQAPASGKTAGDNESPGRSVPEATVAGPLDGLVAMIGDFNNAMSGSNSAQASPVYASSKLNATANIPVVGNQTAASASGGITPEALSVSASLETASDFNPSAGKAGTREAAATGTTKPSSWDALLSWFKEAEVAYNEGNLKEFLQPQR